MKEDYYFDKVVRRATTLFQVSTVEAMLSEEEQLEKAINRILDFIFQKYKFEIQYGVYTKSSIFFTLTKKDLCELNLTPSVVLYHMVDLNTILHTKAELTYIHFDEANLDTMDPSDILEVHLNFEGDDE